jgi:hypothetical protein
MHHRTGRLLLLLLSGINLSCQSAPEPAKLSETNPAISSIAVKPDSIQTIHVIVALCDNKYQGIVPVPAGIGNGQNPQTNLYWGAGYGVFNFFKKSADWILVRHDKTDRQKMGDSVVLERALFRNRQHPVYLLAEAYDGREIKQAIIDFLAMANGRHERPYPVPDSSALPFGGQSDLVAFIGHNGLMDFDIPTPDPPNTDNTRDAIVLACYSKNYFSNYIRSARARPVLWSTHLMAPEAYVLHDALREWCKEKPAESIRMAAARAYAKYQRCSLSAAQKLLVAGF